MGKKQFVYNIVSVLVYFFVAMGINLVLTSYIVAVLGNEAYGFSSIASNFVSYFVIITTGLNQMATRFVSVEFHRKNYKRASMYFNSDLFGNIVLGAIIFFISVVMICFLERILDIPTELLNDVKWTFFIAFLDFISAILFNVFSCATYIKNRVDLNSLKMIVYNFFKGGVILILYIALPAKIYYISLAGFLGTLLNAALDVYYTKKLIPEIRVSFKQIELKAIWELVTSGIWYSFISLGTLLATGFDLLIANQMIGNYYMGLLSVAKTLPMAVNSLVSAITSIFNPRITKCYAENNLNKVQEEVNFAIRFMGFIISAPLSGVFILGKEFLNLWLPGKTSVEIRIIYIAMIFSILPEIMNGMAKCLGFVPIIVKKLKASVLVSFLGNVISIVLVFMFIGKVENEVAIYLIAGVSSIIMLIRHFVFIPAYAGYVLGLKKRTFYVPLVKGIMATIICSALFYFIKLITRITLNTWKSFVLFSLVLGGIGYVVSAMWLMKGTEMKKLISKVWH